MYALAGRSRPDAVLELTLATFAEMALAGITLVGEFHYLHHGPGGTRYEDPNAMGIAVLRAAREAGVRITLLDACYLHGGIDVAAEGPQLRFCDADADDWRGASTGSPMPSRVQRAAGAYGWLPPSTACAR